MAAEAQITDVEIEELFRADPLDGLRFLHLERKEYLFQYIKRKARGLKPEEIADVYQDTMVDLIEIVQGPNFDSSEPMRIVRTVAGRRAFDALRRKGYRAAISLDDALHHIASDLKNSDLDFQWKLHSSDWAKFRKVMDQAIDSLPEKQKIAALAFLDVYEDVRGPKQLYLPLAERIREISGDDVTTAQAKDRWREARQTIAEKLRRAGLKILLEDDQ